MTATPTRNSPPHLDAQGQLDLLSLAIRFIINHLGLSPPCGASVWDKKLKDGEKVFFEQFTSKRYKT